MLYPRTGEVTDPTQGNGIKRVKDSHKQWCHLITNYTVTAFAVAKNLL